MKNINNELDFVLTPGYISGLTQSDGSFFCTISLSSKHLFGLQFRPKFSITADFDSKHVLDSIQSYFGCGSVSINENKHTAEFVVSSLKDLKNIIIPHFQNFPVFCAKLHAFQLFVLIVDALFNKEKRTIEGRRELLGMALSMNHTTNRKEDRIEVLCKSLSISDSKDLVLIPNTCVDIQAHFKGIGSIREGSKNELVYTVLGINQIVDVLIPFMEANPIFSERALHYAKFRQVSLLMKEQNPLSLESKLEIVDLCYDMNKEGKRRALSKSQYIALLNQKHR